MSKKHVAILMYKTQRNWRRRKKTKKLYGIQYAPPVQENKKVKQIKQSEHIVHDRSQYLHIKFCWCAKCNRKLKMNAVKRFLSHHTLSSHKLTHVHDSWSSTYKTYSSEVKWCEWVVHFVLKFVLMMNYNRTLARSGCTFSFLSTKCYHKQHSSKKKEPVATIRYCNSSVKMVI